MDHGGSVIMVLSDGGEARRLLQDIAENEDVRSALTDKARAAKTLRDYGVWVSDDAIPERPTLPPAEDVRKLLADAAAFPAPHTGFRPPACPDTGLEGPPPYSSSFGHIFSIIFERAKPQGETTS
ncbi:MAG TPA: hypothetical protein VGU26_09080 [Gaiellaceae bacterium]|nr:hypothetical protein [Gaiellaceae bacterium]